jgi:hypothetical protein
MREGPAGCGAQAIPITLKFLKAITIKKTALTPLAPSDEEGESGDKIARLDQRRARHGSDD